MVRIQFELSEEQTAALEALMKEVNIRTKKDFFNNALTFFEWAIKEKRAGRRIASVDEHDKKLREIVMPALENTRSYVAAEPSLTASLSGGK